MRSLFDRMRIDKEKGIINRNQDGSFLGHALWEFN